MGWQSAAITTTSSRRWARHNLKSVELEKAGNVLDLESSQNAEEAARRGMAIFNQVVGQQGYLDLITVYWKSGLASLRVAWLQNAERIRKRLRTT